MCIYRKKKSLNFHTDEIRLCLCGAALQHGNGNRFVDKDFAMYCLIENNANIPTVYIGAVFVSDLCDQWIVKRKNSEYNTNKKIMIMIRNSILLFFCDKQKVYSFSIWLKREKNVWKESEWKATIRTHFAREIGGLCFRRIRSNTKLIRVEMEFEISKMNKR